MNRDILRGNWNQLKGSVKERWGELTENEVAEAEGNYDQLVGKIQERYGYEREEAEREVDRWLEKQRV
ncbi:MAG TPA: CsbD family protein [Caldilineaceae bacterium]|nr:CsbD family protein [Caldilineaceae bacterium]